MSITARLHPPVHEVGIPYNGLYCVEFNGEFLVVGSRNPECDAARALLARGITGKLTITQADNNRDKALKGRAPCGERHPMAKLAKAQIAAIRQSSEPGIQRKPVTNFLHPHRQEMEGPTRGERGCMS